MSESVLNLEIWNQFIQYVHSQSCNISLFSNLTWNSAVFVSFFQCLKQILFFTLFTFLTSSMMFITVLTVLSSLSIILISCADISQHWEHDEKINFDISETCRSKSVSFYLILIKIKVKVALQLQTWLCSSAYWCNTEFFLL